MKRMQFLLGALLGLSMLLSSIAAEPQKKPAVRVAGLYAVFETSMGTFVCQLYEKLTPVAVENFVGLAEGTREWMTTKGELMKKPFYNGMIFHRIVKKVTIQAGDITGKGGNFRAVIPFDNEIAPTLDFNQPGMLAMANNGPKTNITQFFVTAAPAPNLNGKYTIFGKVVEGLPVVQSIANVPLLASKPVTDVVIKKISIERVGRK
jgi:peptidyl-prolyl cis-trans isomerase A (cyclophilin A)